MYKFLFMFYCNKVKAFLATTLVTAALVNPCLNCDLSFFSNEKLS